MHVKTVARLPLLGAFLSLHNLQLATAATYSLSKEYIGKDFFNDWTFYDHYDDLTNGDAIFVSASVGASAKLAFIDPSTNHAIIKVDNTTNVPWNEKRNTVKITTNDRFAVGSVWIADMYHIPYGCSVWPAFWSQAPKWPEGGEIDILEGVNLAKNNQMGLHTLPGCKQVSPTEASTSNVLSTDCSSLTNNNQGCAIIDGDTASYGEAFAKAGGGVWITEFAESGISIWFYSRAKVPQGVTTGTTLDTSTLGTPVANWPSTGCEISKFFEPQHVVFDITLCGDFANGPGVFAQTCSGKCYEDYVVGNGSVYATAYFDIASFRIFGNIASSDNSTNSGGSAGGNNTNGNSTGTGSGANKDNGAIATRFLGVWAWTGAVALGLMALV